MRTPLLIALAFTAGALMGCGAEQPRRSVQEETASTGRDLTLQAPRVPAAEVASAMGGGEDRSDPSRRPALTSFCRTLGCVFIDGLSTRLTSLNSPIWKWSESGSRSVASSKIWSRLKPFR